MLSNAKKVLRESAQTTDTEQVREKMEDLQKTMDMVTSLSSERLRILERVLRLAEHFYEIHGEINDWSDDIKREVSTQMNPGMRPDQIVRSMDTGNPQVATAIHTGVGALSYNELSSVGEAFEGNRNIYGIKY